MFMDMIPSQKVLSGPVTLDRSQNHPPPMEKIWPFVFLRWIRFDHLFSCGGSVLTRSVTSCEIYNEKEEKNPSLKTTVWNVVDNYRIHTCFRASFLVMKTCVFLHSSTTLAILLTTGRSVRSCDVRQHYYGKSHINPTKALHGIEKQYLRFSSQPLNLWEDLVWLNWKDVWE